MILIEKIANDQEKVASKYIAKETVRRMREAFKRMRAQAGKPKKGILERFMTPEGVKKVKARELKKILRFRKKPGTEIVGGAT